MTLGSFWVADPKGTISYKTGVISICLCERMNELTSEQTIVSPSRPPRSCESFALYSLRRQSDLKTIRCRFPITKGKFRSKPPQSFVRGGVYTAYHPRTTSITILDPRFSGIIMCVCVCFCVCVCMCLRGVCVCVCLCVCGKL